LKKKRNRINEEIRAPELRVINDKGEMLGVMSSSDALAAAKKAGIDLIEIAPMAKPPVAKIIEYGKFKYIEEKKMREQKKKAKSAELKEVRLSPFIAEGDYMTRIRRMDRFLKGGHKVRVVVVFKGRHMGSRGRGYELMREVLDSLSHEVSIDMEPKFLGRHLAMVISPLKKIKADTKNAHVKEQKS
jgi:translation initiation factor IF-3